MDANILDWAGLVVLFLAVLLLLDWALPRRLRLVAVGLFKETPDDMERFYATYRGGFLARMLVAMILSLVGATIIRTQNQFEIQASAAITVMAIYVLLLAYDVWRAERKNR
jgi:hypothetical protein